MVSRSISSVLYSAIVDSDNQSVANAVDGPLHFGLAERIGQCQGAVLGAGVAVVYETGRRELERAPSPGVGFLLERRQNQIGSPGYRGLPAEYSAGVHVDDERDVTEAGQRPYICKVGYPQARRFRIRSR